VTGGTTFLEQLQSYDEIAREAALRYLADTGFTDHLAVPAEDYLHRGGKGLRPALCLATAEAFGAQPERAVASAAAIELLHTAFLVHDDVEDDSALRRGEPTLHRRYGRGTAVNSGDGLAVVALGALRDNDRLLGSRLAAQVWAEFAFMARQTVDGQARELAWNRDGHTDLTPDDYLDLIMQKTCWYTTVLPLRVGTLIGGGRRVDLEPMLRLGFYLGAAFQIRDDILNLTGSVDRYGKEPLGDLREGKRTLMIIHLLEACNASDRDLVLQFLRRQPAERSLQQCEQIRALMAEHGSIGFASEFAAGIADSAGETFEAAFGAVPEGPARRFVAALVPYMVRRDR
jgi:geranylgeranyl diphosphate synthase type II